MTECKARHISLIILSVEVNFTLVLFGYLLFGYGSGIVYIESVNLTNAVVIAAIFLLIGAASVIGIFSKKFFQVSLALGTAAILGSLLLTGEIAWYSMYYNGLGSIPIYLWELFRHTFLPVILILLPQAVYLWLLFIYPKEHTAGADNGK